MSASAFRWPFFAIFSLLVAAAVAFLATQMVSQQIGISSEPVSAGEELTPKTGAGQGGQGAAATPQTPGASASGGAQGAQNPASEGGEGGNVAGDSGAAAGPQSAASGDDYKAEDESEDD